MEIRTVNVGRYRLYGGDISMSPRMASIWRSLAFLAVGVAIGATLTFPIAYEQAEGSAVAFAAQSRMARDNAKAKWLDAMAAKGRAAAERDIQTAKLLDRARECLQVDEAKAHYLFPKMDERGMAEVINER